MSRSIDVAASVNEYLQRADWRVNANANQGFSLGGLILNVSGKVIANYWLDEVYTPELGDAHRAGDVHVHDLDVLGGYCAGWSLRQLLQEGFGGVPGMIESAPAKHFSSALGQIVNFFGTLQNEWAGAQAFSSFDTLLAPYVRADKLTYQQVHQGIQELIHNLNVPSRWGCVDQDTEVLSTEGWKRHDELCEGDQIYTWKDGRLNINTVRKVVVKPFAGQLHSYRGRNYDQTVTPNHRVLTLDHNSRDARIRISEDIFTVETPFALPVRMKHGNELKPLDLTDDQITLAAMIYADGSIEMRGSSVHKVHYSKSPGRWGYDEIREVSDALGLTYTTSMRSSNIGSDQGYREYETAIHTFYGDAARSIVSLVGRKDQIDRQFLAMDSRQAELFLNVWMRHDGDPEKETIQCANPEIVDVIQQIALIAGRTSYLKQRGKTTWVKLRKVESIIPAERVSVDYDGIVWCPNVEDGTAVFRKNGSVYISGQTQTPFTNLTFDLTCPADFIDTHPVIGDEVMDFTYGDLAPEMDLINRAYIEVMTAGDAAGRVFTFPIPTYNITADFDWDSPLADVLFEMTAKYGTPYFQNFINSDLKPGDVRSMCCRLQLNLKELLSRGNGLFGSGEQTGSIGVVTVNMARLGYVHNGDWDALIAALDRLIDLSADSLETKRVTVAGLMNDGLFPYTRRYLGTLDSHFSTIGVNGINEMIRNFTQDAENITTPDGYELAVKVLDHVRERLVDIQERTGHLYNLEATPAEGTTYRFAKEDRARFTDIIQAGTDEQPYYTNSSQLPVGYTDDPFEALEMQDELQRKYTGGTVLHLYMGERVSDSQACKSIVRRALTKFRLPYLTITPTFSVCQAHGYLSGEHFTCPTCGADAEVWTRVMGYFRPVTSFNIGKKGEYAERVTFREELAHA